jgi:hypothetical protein
MAKSFKCRFVKAARYEPIIIPIRIQLHFNKPMSSTDHIFVLKSFILNTFQNILCMSIAPLRSCYISIFFIWQSCTIIIFRTNESVDFCDRLTLSKSPKPDDLGLKYTETITSYKGVAPGTHVIYTSNDYVINLSSVRIDKACHKSF